MASETEPEPITITDKRRIDPETGQLREQGKTMDPHNETDPGIVDESDAQEGTANDGDGGDTEAVAPSDSAAAQIEELTADLKRAQADFVNYKRRVERDRQSVVEAAKASVLSELLVVLDDLDRAKSHGDLEGGPLKGVADKLTNVLSAQGLTAFGEVGDAFDPALHEAVQHSGDGINPVVEQVFRKGYRIGDRTVRNAMVVVGDSMEANAQSHESASNDSSSAE